MIVLSKNIGTTANTQHYVLFLLQDISLPALGLYECFNLAGIVGIVGDVQVNSEQSREVCTLFYFRYHHGTGWSNMLRLIVYVLQSSLCRGPFKPYGSWIWRVFSCKEGTGLVIRNRNWVELGNEHVNGSSGLCGIKTRQSGPVSPPSCMG
jgi:hypothetical protein